MRPDLLQADMVNALFELAAALFILNHCRVLHRQKQVRGVSVISCIFFTLWGAWNLYFYPTLNQPLSYHAGMAVVAANAFYVALIIHYGRVEDLARLSAAADQPTEGA